MSVEWFARTWLRFSKPTTCLSRWQHLGTANSQVKAGGNVKKLPGLGFFGLRGAVAICRSGSLCRVSCHVEECCRKWCSDRWPDWVQVYERSHEFIHLCLCVYIYMYAFVYLHICTYVYNMHLSMHSGMYMREYTCIYIYIYMYICVYICIYMCIYVCVDSSSMCMYRLVGRVSFWTRRARASLISKQASREIWRLTRLGPRCQATKLREEPSHDWQSHERPSPRN